MTIYVRSIVTACLVAAVVVLTYAYFIEPRRLVIVSETVKISNWSKAFDNLKIVAISDLHAGSNGVDAQRLKKIVRSINEQNPDIIVLLGDYVSRASDDQNGAPQLKMDATEIADNLRGLTAKFGVFAVLGNQDGAYNDEVVSAALAGAGIRVLRNQIALIDANGQKLRILGLNDHLKLQSWNTFDADVRNIISTLPPEGDVIVLEHSPDIFQVLNYYKMLGGNFKLMLAGHTHGGQISLPIIGAPIVPSSFGQKYNRGLIREDGTQMFVTSGIGTSALPFRFMVPPEIAVVNIKSN